MPRKADIAWAAGLFEGEGTIIIGSREKTYFQLSMSSTDFDVIERFHGIVKYGAVRYQEKIYPPTVKHFWVWRAGGLEAAFILEDFMPWLGERRAAKAQEALKRYETDEKIEAQEESGAKRTENRHAQEHRLARPNRTNRSRRPRPK